MPRLLISKGKKTYVEELKREVTVLKPKEYTVHDTSKDFSTTYGVIAKKDLKKKDGSKIQTSMHKEFIILTPGFSDTFRRLKKTPQAIMLKDAGIIAAETGIGKESTVLDAGTGSGWLSCYLAHICKKVVTYDINQEFQDVAKKNADILGLTNISFKKGSVYEKISEKNMDVIILDLPEPWRALPHAVNAIKIGGWLVSYSPSVPQVQSFCNTARAHEEILLGKTIEIVERSWKVEGDAVHPKSISIGHTAFITFCRKITTT